MILNGVRRQVTLLKATVSKMLSLVSDSIDRAAKSLEELCESEARYVILLDNTIDNVNREVERKVYEIFSSQKMDERDIRYAATMIKFANNLERIGDLACNIAEKTLLILQKGLPFRMPKELKDMFGIVLKMVHDSFKAFSSRNVDFAIEIWKRDCTVDELEEKVRSFITENICRGMPPELAYIYILIAKDLERIGDHVTNLCEEIVFIEAGKELTEVLKEGERNSGEDLDCRR